MPDDCKLYKSHHQRNTAVTATPTTAEVDVHWVGTADEMNRVSAGKILQTLD